MVMLIADSHSRKAPQMLTEQQRLILAALAAAGTDAKFSPVQVQKLFFLLDKNIADHIGGAKFGFKPYDYGPFDQAVYNQLDELGRIALVQVLHGDTPGKRRYTLTPAGAQEGGKQLSAYPGPARDYMAAVATWVRKLSFAQLVGSIYKAYPEMKVNSVFQD